MNRAELLEIAKPILMNTEMVRATIRAVDPKTETRRPIKGRFDICKNINGEITDIQRKDENDNWIGSVKPPYQKGDILYVRETCYLYGHWVTYHNGDPEEPQKDKQSFIWDKSKPPMYLDNPPKIICKNRKETGYFIRPSIHMPKEAARIFLRVTDLGAERVQDITEEDAMAEGIIVDPNPSGYKRNDCLFNFAQLWGLVYGNWSENPWVWVIKFEKVSAS